VQHFSAKQSKDKDKCKCINSDKEVNFKLDIPLWVDLQWREVKNVEEGSDRC
jgi:hypothetical protein